MSARKTPPTLPMKPYCKFCHDTGKPESIYRSHYVKTAPGPNGVIVCPTLANQECRYCHQKGHTVKHCSVLEERKKQEEREAKRNVKKQEPTIKEKVTTTVNICNNMYLCLDVVEPEPVQEEVAISLKPISMSYASALAKPAPIQEEDDAPIVKFEPAVIQTKPGVFKHCRITNWADWSDSDEEDLKF
jgi:hypothetical protein